jgi:oligopeptide/dipeptide ABC transporter ATP-binding protein
VLTGDPPSPLHPPAGCAFHPRCPFAQERCRTAVPPLARAADDREVACIRVDEISSSDPV